ncbi:hypothetical protein AB0P32_35310 [Streptomyces sp. NPDC085995]|uniref:hypothetical protein n=1 Tax=Streptomyces sp. NPDC085995 TaxID=3154861 RepID=UPI003439BC1A
MDEAQWLNSEAFEYFRYLRDDYATQLAIVFVGGQGCSTVLRKEPILASRIFTWQKFSRPTPEEVLEATRCSTRCGRTRNPTTSSSPTRTPPTAASTTGPD